MMRLKYSDESMIHFRKSKNYLNVAKMNFKDTSDCVNGVFEIDEENIGDEIKSQMEFKAKTEVEEP